MIIVSITATAFITLLGLSPASSMKEERSAAEPEIGIPRIPHVRIPRPSFKFPRLRRPDGSGVALEQSAKRLKALVRDEEAWYADHGRYSKDVNAIRTAVTKADATLDGVSVQILFADRRGWTAMASHADAPGKSCVIFVGYRTLVPRTRGSAVEAVKEGLPACDP